MSNSCPDCGFPIKTVPAGVSKKTGKHYNEFQCCSNRNCAYKPPREQKPLKSVPPELKSNAQSFVNDATLQTINARLAMILKGQETILTALNAQVLNKVDNDINSDLDQDWK